MDIHDRIKKARQYRGYSQDYIAHELKMTKQAWGRKERGEIDGFSPEDFEKFVTLTDIDARWIFGQLSDVPIEDADLRTRQAEHNYSDLVQEVAELKSLYKPRENDPVIEKVRVNEKIREIVDQIKNLEGNTLGEIKAMIFAYLYENNNSPKRGTGSGNRAG